LLVRIEMKWDSHLHSDFNYNTTEDIFRDNAKVFGILLYV
jgi:hypothetical protein